MNKSTLTNIKSGNSKTTLALNNLRQKYTFLYSNQGESFYIFYYTFISMYYNTNVQFTKGFTYPLEYILYDFYFTQAVQVRNYHGVINPSFVYDFMVLFSRI